MTRTERAAFPRAILKDRYVLDYFCAHFDSFFASRSESKSGLDKSLRKSGGGAHNWGSIKDELALEQSALDDELLDSQELSVVTDDVNQAVRPSVEGPVDDNESVKSTGSPTDEEVEKAREFRAHGLKGDGKLCAHIPDKRLIKATCS